MGRAGQRAGSTSGGRTEDVALEVAATLPVATLTVVRALQIAGSLLGKRMLVTGAAGGVGQFAIQMGRSAGADVTGVSSRRPEWQALHPWGSRNGCKR